MGEKGGDSPESTEVMHILGEIKGKACLLVDDLIATGSSLVEAAEALRRAGATSVSACVTHPVLSGPARSRVASSCLKELIVTDTIPLTQPKRHPKITVLSVAPLLSEAIRRIHYERSVSGLFDGIPG